MSSRLQTIFNLLTASKDVWDIGCDHGILGIKAISSEKFKRVYFVDPSKGALEKIEKKIRGPLPKNSFLNCKGQDLNWNIVSGNVVLAGFGSQEMVDIITSAQKYINNIEWVLSPNSNPWTLRWKLRECGIRLVSEKILVERGRIRQVLKCAPLGIPIHPFINDPRQSLGPAYISHCNKVLKTSSSWLRSEEGRRLSPFLR